MGRVLAALGVAAVLAFVVIACGESGGSVETPPAVGTQAPTAGTSPTGAATTQAPTAAASPTGTPAGGGGPNGARLFADNCSGCHSADGSGGQGPDIRSVSDVDLVKNQVEQGGGGMPSFAGQLTPAEIQAVAKYVTTKL